MLISVNQSSKCSSLSYAPHQIFHNKCKVLSAFKEVTLQLQTDIGKGVILTLSVLQDPSQLCEEWLSFKGRNLLMVCTVVQNTRCEVVMLKNTSIIMKFIIWIINDIHVEFNDIHWEGCLHITRRATTVPPSALGEDKEAFRKKDGRSRPD